MQADRECSGKSFTLVDREIRPRISEFLSKNKQKLNIVQNNLQDSMGAWKCSC